MTTKERDFEKERARMVKDQLFRHNVRDEPVLRAMSIVPREAFVPEQYQNMAYADSPLPIPAGQTISQPYVVAYMLELLDLQPGDKALEIGSGSGYAAAIMSRIVTEVHAVERHKELVAYSRERLEDLGYGNVIVHHGDGTVGWEKDGLFDAILVSAGGPRVPQALKAQLAPGGRLVMPVGRKARSQVLVKVIRSQCGDFRREEHGLVAFVPLIGEAGWNEQDAERE
jgi:protein-L-isoaspartate(D-aspartate) O-methyltransferase